MGHARRVDPTAPDADHAEALIIDVIEHRDADGRLSAEHEEQVGSSASAIVASRWTLT